ncbi:MAG: response regulator [Candidatus Aminicenantes bacterium]|nr:response regulator [Candidatus Aminicenantes bacterium]
MTNIMVVDDEATITTQLEERLASLGYKVVASASSGLEAVQKAKETKPDIILMDIVMPGKMDGIKAAEQIKKECNIPVVFLTAYGDDQFIQRAKSVEPLGYIIKPYNENELKAAIEIALFNKQIVNELKASETEWRALAESTHQGIILTDKKENIFFWNKGAEKIFGYDQDEVKEKTLSMIISEGTKSIFEQRKSQLISSDLKNTSCDWMEVVGVKKDWSRFPMKILLKTREVDNNDYFICIVRDVTKEKKIESQMKTKIKEKENLIQDFQDHLKNNLSLVYKLLSMQLDTTQPKQFVSKAQEYFQHFEPSSAHKQFSKINMSKYIKTIIKRLFASYKTDENQITPQVHIRNIFADAKTATLCGLMVSELVSNSIKHAFPSQKRGMISVSFLQENENQYRLKVKDNGIGLPEHIDFKEPASRGLEIIQDITSQLNGTIQIHREHGTEVTVSFVASD